MGNEDVSHRMSVSTKYRKLEPHEVPRVAQECAQAWKSELIPWRQWEVVKGELEAFEQGNVLPVYAAFLRCMKNIPPKAYSNFLDVGASGAHYWRIMKHAGYHLGYTAFDFSEAFKRFARQIYPDVNYDVADARELPYTDEHFDIVLSSACIMHVHEYDKAIKETARVSKNYVIFHRTPVFTDQPTAFFLKEGYGIPMLEVHFNESELIKLFMAYGLDVVYSTDVFFNEGFGHRSYLLAKQAELFHHQV